MYPGWTGYRRLSWHADACQLDMLRCPAGFTLSMRAPRTQWRLHGEHRNVQCVYAPARKAMDRPYRFRHTGPKRLLSRHEHTAAERSTSEGRLVETIHGEKECHVDTTTKKRKGDAESIQCKLDHSEEYTTESPFVSLPSCWRILMRWSNQTESTCLFGDSVLRPLRSWSTGESLSIDGSWW